jgi:S1-C subfamily serine protease
MPATLNRNFTLPARLSPPQTKNEKRRTKTIDARRWTPDDRRWTMDNPTIDKRTTHSGDVLPVPIRHYRGMPNETLTTFSNALADIVANAASSVVQVQGGRTPASGLAYGDAIVLTTVRNIGGEEGLRVRGADGATFDAELAGWDPTTTLAVLRVTGLAAPALTPSTTETRVGHLVVAVARSWSNN